MKFIKTYLPETLFLTAIILFWSFVFSVTNIGHTVYERFMSILLVVTLNGCAFIAFHIAWKLKRMKNDTFRHHNLLLIIKPDGLEHSSEVLKEIGACGKLHDLIIVPELPRERVMLPMLERYWVIQIQKRRTKILSVVDSESSKGILSEMLPTCQTLLNLENMKLKFGKTFSFALNQP